MQKSPYGLKPNGFAKKPYEQILADIETRQRARISPYVDQSENSPLGHINRIKAREIYEKWCELEAIQNGFDPDKAKGASLEALGKLTGTERRGETYSVTQLSCALDVGTKLLAGAHFVQVEGDPDNRWTPVADFEAPSTGNHPVQFRAEFAGAVTAAANSITVIATPVTGWSSVVASTVPTPGHGVDNDTTLRARREQALTQTGNATRAAIRADVLEVAGVIDCIVLANPREYTDSDGVPPYHVEVIVWDGPTPAAVDSEIAAAIHQGIGPTVPTFGDTTVTITEYDGKTLDVKFSRVEMLNVYLDLFLTTGAGYVGDTAVKDYVVAQSTYGVGEDIIALDVRVLPLALQGVTDVPTLELGFAASPSGTANLAVGPRQIALLDASRITVTT